MSGSQFLPALVLDVGYVLAVILLGWLLASLIDDGGHRLFAMALAFPLGAGLLTLMMFVLSLLGVPLSRTLLFSVLGVGILGFGLGLAYRSVRDAAQVPSPDARGGWAAREHPALIAMVLMFAASVAVSIGRSYSTWDAAAIWGVKGYGVALQRTIWAASEWGAYGLSYPLNVPLQIAAFAGLDGDVVPGSKLIFPLYYGSLALGLLAYFRHKRSNLGAWGAAFVMALPIVFDHATQGYANLLLATYLVLGTLLAVEAASSERRGMLALSGIALGLAVWTRPEGLALVGVAYAAIWIGARVGGLAWRPGWVWFWPTILVGGAWLAFSLTNGEANPLSSMLNSAKTALVAGQFNLTAFYWILRYLVREMLRPSVWGLFFPVLAVGAFLRLRKSHGRQSARDWMILATGAATGSFILAFYYLISFSGDLEWWLDTGLSRMLLPSAALLTIWAVAPWTDTPEAARQGDPPEGWR